MGTYTVVCWPESQSLMDKEGFDKNSYPIIDEQGVEDFGSSAYFINTEWLNQLE